ncbi:MAG TPA: PAS domain S-box protein [Candidatus Angelobacter sp.]|nr:PAS domain S-box protein [Candidatus Angelobacter sp.]
MKDYARLTRAELIDRVEELERKTAVNAVQQAERTRERHRTQAALRDSEERLRAILETAVEGIITIDGRGIIESANPAAEKIFGYRAAEIIGKNVSALMPSPYREAHDGYLANYLRTGHAKIIGIGREVVGRRKDGSIFPMDLSVSEVRLADRCMFTGFVRDITERKRLEREILEASNREQRRIGQDLHDGLSQQLAGIELMCGVLEQKLAVKARAEADRAGEIARHVREAIAHTRRLARGLSPVQLEANGLMSALQELAPNVERMFMIECRFQYDEPILIQNNAAATHLYRIAQEAINNAIKHGKAKKILIAFRTMGDKHCLLISNDGARFPGEAKQSQGMGLRIMEYRAGEIGASLQIQGGDGPGTTVTCAFDKNL